MRLVFAIAKTLFYTPQMIRLFYSGILSTFICLLGWMDDLRYYVIFNSVSVISGRWEVDNERLCAMELRLRLGRFRLERGLNSSTRSVGQR